MNIRAATYQDLISRGWTLEYILGEMLRLDRMCIHHIPDHLVGTVAQWLRIYADFPETWRAMVTPENEIVAYWHFASVGEDIFYRLSKGEILDADLDRSSIVNPSHPGHLFMYLTSFSVHSAYRSPRMFWLLLSAWMAAIEDLAVRGVFFRSLVVHAVTDDARQLCRHTNMDCQGPHPIGIGSIYTLNFMPPPNLCWLRRFPELVGRYANESVPVTPRAGVAAPSGGRC